MAWNRILVSALLLACSSGQHQPASDGKNTVIEPIEGFSVEQFNCYISFSECIAHPTSRSDYDGKFAMNNLGVDYGAAYCLPRAMDWFHHCKNPPGFPVVATYIPTGESMEYPSQGDGERCQNRQRNSRYLFQDACPSTAHTAGGDDKGHGAAFEKQRVAIVVAGQLFRFAWQTLYEGLIRPNVDAGHDVDVYIYLSRQDAGGMHNNHHWRGFATDQQGAVPTNGEFDRPDSPEQACDWDKEEALRIEVARLLDRPASGGRGASSLKGWEISSHWVIVSSIGKWRFSQWQGRDKAARIYQYVGWYRAWQLVQNYEVSARMHYDSIVLTRSDAFWLGAAAPVNMFSGKAISYKPCPSQSYMGIYDKIFIVPRIYAHAWLEAVVYMYVDTAVTASFFNNEHFLLRFAMGKHIPLCPAPSDATLPMLPLNLSTVYPPSQEREEDVGCFAAVHRNWCQCLSSSQCEFVQSRGCGA